MIDPPGHVRMLSMFTRRPDLDPVEFHRYWQDVHAPLAAALPGLRGYRQYEVIDEILRPGQVMAGPPIDGVAELVFDSWDERQQAYASAAGAALMADGGNFVHSGRTLRVVRRDILQPR